MRVLLFSITPVAFCCLFGATSAAPLYQLNTVVLQRRTSPGSIVNPKDSSDAAWDFAGLTVRKNQIVAKLKSLRSTLKSDEEVYNWALEGERRITKFGLGNLVEVRDLRQRLQHFEQEGSPKWIHYIDRLIKKVLDATPTSRGDYRAYNEWENSQETRRLGKTAPALVPYFQEGIAESEAQIRNLEAELENLRSYERSISPIGLQTRPFDSLVKTDPEMIATLNRITVFCIQQFFLGRALSGLKVGHGTTMMDQYYQLRETLFTCRNAALSKPLSDPDAECLAELEEFNDFSSLIDAESLTQYRGLKQSYDSGDYRSGILFSSRLVDLWKSILEFAEAAEKRCLDDETEMVYQTRILRLEPVDQPWSDEAHSRHETEIRRLIEMRSKQSKLENQIAFSRVVEQLAEVLGQPIFDQLIKLDHQPTGSEGGVEIRNSRGPDITPLHRSLDPEALSAYKQLWFLQRELGLDFSLRNPAGIQAELESINAQIKPIEQQSRPWEGYTPRPEVCLAGDEPTRPSGGPTKIPKRPSCPRSLMGAARMFIAPFKGNTNRAG